MKAKRNANLIKYSVGDRPKKTVWVVETNEGDGWRPLHWVHDRRDEARAERDSWKGASGCHEFRKFRKFRIKKYIRAD